MSPEAQREKWRNEQLKKRWGLTVEQFESMVAAQGGVCRICQRPEKSEYKRRLSVDHDHLTGEIRGLLCHMCNTGIGKFEDNPALLVAAAAYLKGEL